MRTLEDYIWKTQELRKEDIFKDSQLQTLPKGTMKSNSHYASWSEFLFIIYFILFFDNRLRASVEWPAFVRQSCFCHANEYKDRGRLGKSSFFFSSSQASLGHFIRLRDKNKTASEQPSLSLYWRIIVNCQFLQVQYYLSFWTLKAW